MAQLRKYSLLIILIIVGFSVPSLLPNEYYLQVLIMGYIWAIAVYGLNIILGFTGQLSLGHAGFFGIGAYTVALLTLQLKFSFWSAMLGAILLNLAVGYLVSLISFRTKGHYFAIFTMAVGVIINLVIEKWESLTNGNIGLVNIPGPSRLGPIAFEVTSFQYYLIFTFLILSMYVTYAIRHSLVGRTCIAIRNSEELAQSIGIDVKKNKRLAFLLSTVLAGVAGGLYASYIGFIGPEVSSVNMTFNMLLYVLVGGVGTIAGPLVGSLVVAVLTQLLQVLQQYQMMIFGPVLVVLIIFFPGGIVGGLKMIRSRWMRTSKRGNIDAVLEKVESGVN